ncbi:Bax inhibitor-1/YccA family protein [Fodinisporobacter ferrooxydans]|uniref:Bax inhibitor-1/YccA family protein n=1 Tax=Fodinisporobacter ferrooxydans TaxID=2901836 RepID=A0ABY4CKM0_9BACL|nr:Bax inhibitor-1/YccA family protein [Alicyclobacillaceae bacterium MYW30-H2]
MYDYGSVSQRQYGPARVLPSFFLSLLIGTIGLYAGQFVPGAFFLPLSIIEVVMIFAATFMRRRRAVGFAFVYTFTFISGMTLFPIVYNFAYQYGIDIIYRAFLVTVIAFGGAAAYAAISKANFNFLGGFLFMGVLALVGMGIVNIFIPFSTQAEMIYSVIGILIFIGYVLFDVSRIARYGVAQEDVPLVVLSLYLDFVNLFIFILRFFGVSLRRD